MDDMNRLLPVTLTLADGTLAFSTTNQNRVRLMFQFAYFPLLAPIHAMEMVFAKIQNARVSLVGLVKTVLSEYVNQYVLEMVFGTNFQESVLVTMDGKENGAISENKSARHARMASA